MNSQPGLFALLSALFAAFGIVMLLITLFVPALGQPNSSRLFSPQAGYRAIFSILYLGITLSSVGSLALEFGHRTLSRGLSVTAICCFIIFTVGSFAKRVRA